jgi:hypothetical protein
MRTLALRTLLISIAVSALLGIYAVLVGHFGEFEAKILGTSAAISIASLLAMASFAGWELPASRLVSRAGVATSIVALVFTIGGIWVATESETGWKLVASIWLVAGACAHATLVMLARLAPAQHWLRIATHGTTVMLVMAILAALWGDGDGMWRALAVLSILEGAATLALVVFHFVNRLAPPAGPVAEVCFCPRCGKRLWHPAGEIRCHHCELCFFIELRPSAPLPDAIVR